MALGSVTSAASNIDTDSARLNGAWSQSNSTCCDAPPCSYARRFYYGTSNPPSTLKSAGSVCGESLCGGGNNSYNATVVGLQADRTYFFRASVATSSLEGGCDGNCGGGCGGSQNGSILDFQTCAEDITFSAITLGTPSETSVEASCTVNPKVNETSATVSIQYKLQSEPTVWTTFATVAISSAQVKTWTITGLDPSSDYDLRYTVSRAGVACGDSSDATAAVQFSTLADSIAQAAEETATGTDAVDLEITGIAAPQDQVVGIEEAVDLQLITTDEETFVGVWFYHLPTRSYWFWNWDNFTAAINDTDADDRARLFVALGSEVYIGDDEEYFFDDRDQRRPISDAVGNEIELSLVPRAVDLGGIMGRVRSIETKWGAPPDIDDPLGNVDIGLLSDVYPKEPIPPNARRVLAERRVPVADEYTGLVEWRPYAVPRVRPAGTIGVRFSWPTGATPRRVAPVEIEAVKLNIVTTGRKRRNR